MKQVEMNIDNLPKSRYRIGDFMVYINEKVKLATMKTHCPLFFKNAPEGEKRVTYRGHLILHQRHVGVVIVPMRSIKVYAFDWRSKKMILIASELRQDMKAMELIDKKLSEVSKNALTLNYETREVLIPVTAKVAVFCDQDGKPVHAELAKIETIGKAEVKDGDPKTTFVCEVAEVLQRQLGNWLRSFV